MSSNSLGEGERVVVVILMSVGQHQHHQLLCDRRTKQFIVSDKRVIVLFASCELAIVYTYSFLPSIFQEHGFYIWSYPLLCSSHIIADDTDADRPT